MSGSTPRRLGAVLGNDPVPTGGGGAGSWACRARPQPALGAASKVISDRYLRNKQEVGLGRKVVDKSELGPLPRRRSDPYLIYKVFYHNSTVVQVVLHCSTVGHRG